MRKTLTAGYILCIAALGLLVSCTATKQTSTTTSRKSSPRFMNGVTMKGKSSKVDMNIAGNQHKHIDNEEYEIPEQEIEPQEPKASFPKERIIVIREGRPKKNNIIDDVQNDSYSLQKYANLLGTTPTKLHNPSLYDFIDEWYGVRYRLGGNDKSGIDCSAFVQKLYENVFSTNVVRTACEQYNSCKVLWETDTMKEGDLVFFYSYTYSRRRKHRKSRITGKHITHVGIYLANSYFVHASSSNGVVISSLRESYWAAKFAGAGVIPKS